MLSRLQNHLQANFPFLKENKLLLAISGGIDSMVLLDLFHKTNYEIAVLHCNFSLRNSESDGDEDFVKQFCEERKISFFIEKFDTKQFAEDYKISIQIAARKLRYAWFYEQLEVLKFDYILTAHHLDDNLETFLINLSRGTGLDGLTGIPEQNDKIIRPLLPFSREEIDNYANDNNIIWRDDSSNESDKYLRNKIRHNIVPILKEINPTFLDSFQKTQNYLKEAQSIVNDGKNIIYKEVVSEKEKGTLYFNLKQLLQLPNYGAYLYQWLENYGFTSWSDINDLVYAQSGKRVFSKEYVLLKDRDFLILEAIKNVNTAETYFIEQESKDVKVPLKISFCKVSDISTSNNKTIFVDEDKLKYPLIIRKWEEGDYFYPLGMQGKKKISKFFKDEKVSVSNKQKIWLLCSGSQIVWVVGMRQDERFKIEKHTINIVQITLQ